MSSQVASICPRCGAENVSTAETCPRCLWHLGGARKALAGGVSAAAPEAALSATPQAAERTCRTCGRAVPAWRSDCEHCKTLATPLSGVEPAFMPSLGIGCGSLVLANVASNVILAVLAAIGGVRDIGSLIGLNLLLLGGISWATLSAQSRSRSEKGQGGLHAGAIALAVTIYIVIQILAVSWLQSAR